MSGRKTSEEGGPVDALEKARPTQAERRETAEHAILEAAKTIVAEKGIEALTLHGAGEVAGYSRALPGHYFGTKDAMVAALVDYLLDSYAVRVREMVRPSDGLDALCDRVAFYIDDGLRDPVTFRAFISILSTGARTSELAQIVARLTRDSIDGIASLIKRARDKGEIRADARPRAEASIIIASMRGVMFQWLINPDHVSLSRVRECLIANIRRSLAP